MTVTIPPSIKTAEKIYAATIMTRPHINIQNVYDYLEEQGTNTQIDYMIPPWQTCFMYYNPRNIVKPGKGNRSELFATVQTFPLTEADSNGPGHFSIIEIGFPSVNVTKEPIIRGAQHFNPDGTRKGDTEFSFAMDFFADQHGNPASEPEALSISKSLYGVILFAIQLAHCKNVELIDEPLTRQQRRRKERKKETIHKVLAIEPFKTKRRNINPSQKTGDIRAMHICRGHFATYTEDRPLFGKYAGTFWRPQHIKGSRSAGKVIKDYDIVAEDTV